MRKLALAALFLAACGGKSSTATTTPEPDNETAEEGTEEAPPAETKDVYGTLVSIEDEAEGVCFVTIIDAESGGEVMYPAPDMCGKGWDDYTDYGVSLTLDGTGNVIELVPDSPD